ncbi:guanylate kinase [Candidatus Poribacteria bacterium]|nr:guanylate kinase [Candidatus Poribacteria bacterium]
MSSEGQLIVISGPSGSGKSSLVDLLLRRNPSLRRSISATTRRPRREERDGVDYHFMSVERFKEGMERGEFLEWAVYNGNYYGTPRKGVDEAISRGEDILLTIEVQGAAQIRRIYPDALLIFILPPSPESLRERIKRRGSESEEEIERRLRIAEDEISKIEIYDFFVINREGELEKAAEEVERIISIGKHRLTRGRIEKIKRLYRVRTLAPV